MSEQFARAYQFMLTHARLLERRIFEAHFQGAPSFLVGEVIRAYRNSDGGLGHALEPDLRCAESQPLFAEVGLAALHEVGFRDPEIALSLCSFLANVADERGLVSPILENARSSPHASHWNVPVTPGLNPTAGICGLLYDQGVTHGWLSRVTETCCAMFLDDPPLEAHMLLSVSRLAEHLPDRTLAKRLSALIASALPKANFFIQKAPVREYGLTPLHFAPTPASPWRLLFTDDQIASHLDDLIGRQQEDGGWPIDWTPPGPMAESEWRGRWTLDAIKSLVAYGRIGTT